MRNIAQKKGATFSREDILAAYEQGRGLLRISKVVGRLIDLTSWLLRLGACVQLGFDRFCCLV